MRPEPTATTPWICWSRPPRSARPSSRALARLAGARGVVALPGGTQQAFRLEAATLSGGFGLFGDRLRARLGLDARPSRCQRAYRAKPVLREQATYAIDHCGLDAIPNLFR